VPALRVEQVTRAPLLGFSSRHRSLLAHLAARVGSGSSGRCVGNDGPTPSPA
jgi:hypothetical protein